MSNETETPEQMQNRLHLAARESVNFLVGQVMNAAELKTVQIMALANTLSLSESRMADTVNSIELLLGLTRQYSELQDQRRLVNAIERAIEIGPAALTPDGG